MRRVLGLAALLGLAAPAGAQPEAGGLQTVCRLPISSEGEGTLRSARRADRPAPCPAAERSATFEVTYTDFPPEAEAAFQAAVDTWACRVRSDVPVRVDAAWTPLGGGTLGSAGPYLVRDFPEAPSWGVWYPAALADALASRDLSDDNPDIDASFNSDFRGWHLGLEPPPEGMYDLYTVVLHEIGHGLGLIGAMTVEDGRGRVGGDEVEGPFVYDLLTEDGAGVSLLDSRVYPDGSVRLARALEADVLADGPLLRRAYGRAVPLYAPDDWVEGGSYSHLDEDTFEPGTPDGLMTPFIARSESIAEPGAVACAALGDLGWGLAGACARLVGGPALVDAGLTVERLGPNPARGRIRLRVQSTVPRLVRVSFYDALGRRLLDAGTAALVAGREQEVSVQASDLAAGVYLVVVEGEGALQALPITVVR